ncbi:glutaredoxin family protein [Pseudomonas sp. FEN]|uniref:glutaredoxin family protein n=1 Tax=Pseudomonas sp. FEN TaxID=2767468 RepID=UPI00174B366F|nr:glutaredoxin family protein [Pseudomonas sp. FEN]CAD5199777.1 Glutaredoxin-like domain-containing protein PA3033 [Pseudomonas sp. FEN]
MPPECQLFGTLGCHLCELAEAQLMPLVVEHGLMVELVDIADSEALFETYGLRIPVLRRVDTGAELGWPFDVEQVVTFLS